MQDYNHLRKDLLGHNITIKDLEKYKIMFELQYKTFMGSVGSFISSDELKNYLYLCLDYYTYNSDGDSLIPDSWYDDLMRLYLSLGNKPFYHADYIGEQTMWPFVKHEAPYMVGSLAKIYEADELDEYFSRTEKNKRLSAYVIAPKYDGVSCCIKREHGKIEYGITRGDGTEGQDITEVVLRASVKLDEGDGFYKCELCVGKSGFESLINSGKTYANRRSATTGLINSPKNVEYAHCITVIPLLYTSLDGHTVKYIADGQETYGCNREVVIKKMHKMFDRLREPDFEFRTDGIVIFPVIHGERIDRSDIMSSSIAFKINAITNDTYIKDVYISVGRLGKAVPMASLVPVEVNETVVTDVSLGSFGNYENYGFHYGEIVKAFSAGNVIPQIKPKEDRVYPKKSEIIKVKYRCPYCNEKLTQKGQEYFCKNQRCDHLISGRIANFIVKLGVENISDRTIEQLVEHGLVKKLPDIFYIKYDNLLELPGFSHVSSSNFIEEIQKIKDKPIPASILIGALGIEKISTKKCERIFASVTLKELLKMSKEKIIDTLLDNEGFAMKTSVVFADEFDYLKDTIKELMTLLNVVPEKSVHGSIVFTGFRNNDWEKLFKEMGYEISDTITSKSVALITPVLPINTSPGSKSTKIKRAEKLGVPIIQYPIIEDFYNKLSLYTLKGVKKGLEKNSLVLYLQGKIKENVL